MAARTYRLKIVQEGREFEAEGDKAFVSEMLKRYGPQALPTSAEPAGQKGERAGVGKRASAVARPTTGKLLSIREFIQQLDLKKHTDITLAFGFYLEKHQGVSQFSPADINNCYYEAKLEPSNTSQMIVQNIKRGFLMAARGAAAKAREEKGKKGYTLTRSGEQFIESKLPR
jgi:hypothetical protein